MTGFYLKHCEAYIRRYEKIYGYFSADEKRVRALKFFKIASTVIMYAAYIGILLFLLVSGDPRLLRAVAVPAAGFVIVTAVRSGVNAPRPYERYPIKPVIPKATKGNSCPSRHSACAVLIAFACLYVNMPAGIVLLILSLAIAASRIIMGVHFPLDVVFGIICGALPAVIGFFIIP